MSTFLSQLEWRFATKKFDPERKLSPEQLGSILRAIRLAPTSFGLQPFHVHVVSGVEIRRKLKARSYLQPQVTDASHYIIFSARTDALERIDAYVDAASRGSALTKLKLVPVRLIMRQSVKAKEKDGTLLDWTRRQAYIALGFALAACAELGVDSCPMEGFIEAAYDELLGLPPHLRSCVALAVGFREEGPAYDKFRFPAEDLFTVVE